ncbi:dTMP kinase [Candidatus Saccharibacteria bacterium]|nr:dTMP kinase [Candidatus Saccharibacteria bacterium]
MSLEGKVIALEGTDGVGKSTHLALLSKYLEDKDYDVLAMSAPSDLYRNDPHVQQYNLTGESFLRPTTLAVMAASDRLRIYDTQIKPHIETGGVVVCDRYKFSAEAYFAMRGADIDLLRQIHTNIPDPDYAVLLTLDAVARLSRLKSRATSNDWEEQSMEYQDSVQSLLLSSWNNDYAVIDTGKSKEEISDEIQEYLREPLK